MSMDKFLPDCFWKYANLHSSGILGNTYKESFLVVDLERKDCKMAR